MCLYDKIVLYDNIVDTKIFKHFTTDFFFQKSPPNTLELNDNRFAKRRKQIIESCKALNLTSGAKGDELGPQVVKLERNTCLCIVLSPNRAAGFGEEY